MAIASFDVPIKPHEELPKGIAAYDEETQSLYVSPEDYETIQRCRGHPALMHAISQQIDVIRIPKGQTINPKRML